MLLAALYSSEHIEKKIRPPPPPPNLKTEKKRQAFVKEIVDRETEEAVEHYQEAFGPDVNVRVMSKAKDDVSDIQYDTVAVVLVEKTLYVACNYKQRLQDGTYQEAPLTAERWSAALKLFTSEMYREFGRTGRRGVTPTSIVYVRAALAEDDLTTLINRAMARVENKKTFYEVNVRPGEADSLEARFNSNRYDTLEWSDLNALPHAEMVLVSHLWGSGTIERLAKTKTYVRKSKYLRMGVTKACCPHCAAVLDSPRLRIPRPAWPSRVLVLNWLSPANIPTEEVFTYQIGLNKFV